MAFSRIVAAAVFGVALASVLGPARAMASEAYIITGRETSDVETSGSGGDQLSDSSERGTVSFNGTSLGAYTVSPEFFSYQGVASTDDYESTMFFGSSVVNGSFLQTGTYSYPDGTTGLSALPFSWEIWLPSPTVFGTATLFTLTGAQGLTLNVTNTSTYSAYNASGVDFDPITGNAIDWTISGQLAPGGAYLGDTPYINNLSYVFRGTVTPEPGSLVFGLTGMAAMAGRWLQRRRVVRAACSAGELRASA